MWSIKKTGKALVIVVCFLVVGIVGSGNGVGSRGAEATTVASSYSYSASAPSASLGAAHTVEMLTTRAAKFRVTSIDMSVTPKTVSTWKCGSYIQVVYSAVFHVVSGPKGGTMVFSYTVNNGRSQTPEKLTILPGQHLSNFVFTWQGSLPSDHTHPGPGGVFVTSPNSLLSHMVLPTGKCK
jgi:hypothetical protein